MGDVFLSPAHSPRWLACPGSIRQIALLPPEEREAKSEDARRGDGRHLLVEKSVSEEQPPASFIGRSLVLEGRYYRDLPMADRVFVPDQSDAVSADHAYQLAAAAARAGAHVVTERDVDITPVFGHPRYDLERMQMVVDPVTGIRSKGKMDLTIFGSDYAQVADYKSGVRHVSEVGCTQTALYMLGVLPEVPAHINRFLLTIVQPESIRTDVPPVRTWELDRQGLEVQRARLTQGAARCTTPDAPLVPGEHCAKTSCPARGSCPALAKESVSVLVGNPPQDVITAPVGEPGGLDMRPGQMPVGTERAPGDLAFALAKEPSELTPEEIANILEAKEMIRSFVSAVERHAYSLHVNGTRIPRHKTVLGNEGNRTYIEKDPDVLRKKFASFGRIGEDGKTAGKLKKADYLEEKVISPAQAAKRIKPLVTARTWKSIEKLWHRPPGQPILVSESDPRDEYVITSTAEAFGVEQEDTAPAPELPDFLK